MNTKKPILSIIKCKKNLLMTIEPHSLYSMYTQSPPRHTFHHLHMMEIKKKVKFKVKHWQELDS